MTDRFLSLIGFLDVLNEQLPADQRLTFVGTTSTTGWISSRSATWAVASAPLGPFAFWTCCRVAKPFGIVPLSLSAEQVSPEAAFVALVERDGWRDEDGNRINPPWEDARFLYPVKP